MDEYVVITWPESQDLMDKDWFNECELINTSHGQQKYGSSAYLIPKERLIELTPYKLE